MAELTEPLYTVKETAEFFKCSPGTIYKLKNEGKLVSLKFGHLKITRESILNLIGDENFGKKQEYTEKG